MKLYQIININLEHIPIHIYLSVKLPYHDRTGTDINADHKQGLNIKFLHLYQTKYDNNNKQKLKIVINS